MHENETMSRKEIMDVIEEGNRHAGVLLEDIEGHLSIALEDHERMDKKIDAVDAKFEDFRAETNRNFNLVFEEMYAMRKEFSKKFEKIDQKFELIDQRFTSIDQKFVSIDQRFEQIDKRLERLERIVLEGFQRIEQKFDFINQRFDLLESSR
jgi:uncharacterized protein (DUF3084 family)